METHLPAKPRRPLRIIHTSDVHLETDTFGSGERGVQLRDKVRNSFGRVIDIANERDADLLLIVGDLFDSARVTEEGLAFAFGTIGRARMPVVMIPGNHDAHDERSIYAGLAPGTLPENLHLILEPDGTTLDFPELATRIWGRAIVGGVLDYRAAPYSGRELGKIQRGAVRLENQMQIFRKRTRRETGVDRSLVMRVVITGDHHYRHPRPPDSSESESEALFGYARGIEQVADDQQQVGVALVGDID